MESSYRYGVNNSDAIQSWKIFSQTVYNYKEEGKPPSKVLLRGPIVKRPSVKIVGIPTWYNMSSQVEAWDKFVKSLPYLPDIETTQYDAVDVTRQMLQDLHRLLYYNIIQAFELKKNYSVDLVQKFSGLMSSLFVDMDRILATNEHFMLEKWIESAKMLATNQKEADLYELNAKLQITLWGFNGEILDYADKQWSSLMLNYYKPRWELFNFYLLKALKNKEDFHQKKFDFEVFTKIEKAFVNRKYTNYSTAPKESSVLVAQQIYLKWRKMTSKLMNINNF